MNTTRRGSADSILAGNLSSVSKTQYNTTVIGWEKRNERKLYTPLDHIKLQRQVPGQQARRLVSPPSLL